MTPQTDHPHRNGADTLTAPASLIQRQFWLINRMQPANSAYNIVSAFNLEGPLDSGALAESINDIVQEHAILRTGFAVQGTGLVQQIHARRPVALVEEDCRGVSPAAAEIRQRIAEEATRPFDLAVKPLIRCRLFRFGDQRHILVLVMHHIIVDLRSKKVFAAELSARYDAKYKGTAPAQRVPVHQYAEYANRQQQWLAAAEAEKMTAYWRGELEGQSGVLNLPVDFPRPVILTYNGDHHPFALSAEETRVLEAFSRHQTVDPFVTLLTAFLVLLARCTNQRRLIIGVPLSNRRHDDDKDTLGCFVNILPLSFDLSDVRRFDEALRQVRLKMLGAHRHQELPFEAILDAVKPKRDPSTNPLFQVGFTAEPPMELTLAGLAAAPLPIHNRGAQLDLFLNIKSFGPELQGHFEFNTDLFAPATIGRLRDHYLTLLRAVVADGEQEIDLLPLLSDREREELLVHRNRTAAPVPDCCLHQLFEEQAAARPEAVAAVFAGESLTYNELNGRANQLAHFLRAQGVGRETLVGIFHDRSLPMLVALFGILKAGAAYVPMDTEFPAHRISQMLEDANPRVILTQTGLADLLPATAAQVVCLDRDWPQIATFSRENPACINGAEDLAYVIFTSGSTGRPKGVQVPQRGVVNFLASMAREPGMTRDDTLLAVTTLSFDIAVLELFLPLAVGARVVLAASDTARNGQALLALLRTSGTTVLQATPTTFHLLLGAGWSEPLPMKVLCGGEPFPADLAQRLTGLAESVWNMYGPTETTVWSTCQRLEGGAPVRIGRPIANTQVYVVNDRLQPAPIGVAGELLIGGLGVTRGYLHRPDLTAQQFIPDCFNPDAATPLYRTGDLAAWLPDGELKHLGRLDHQIKIRGFRIELGDIEAAIQSHPAVRQGVVKPHEFGSGDVRLIAYVTLQPGQESVPLRAYLQDLLPDYMIPALVTVLPEMPLTPNNKIDRKALPAPDRARPELQGQLTLPQNDLEADLARRWAAILHLDQVGVDDTFFDLGGNSLLSIQLLAQLEQEQGIRIPVVKFYQYPTVRLFAQYLRQNEEHSGGEGAPERAQRQKQALARLRQHLGRKAS